MRTLTFVLPLALALSACGGGKDDDTAATGAAAPSAAATAPAGDDPAAEAPGPAQVGFDLEALPISNAPLGEFPYLRLPAGYEHYSRDAGSDFDRVPFWTGDGVEWVEGRIFGSLIQAADGKAFSLLELRRNLQAVITDAGGVKIAEGKIPSALLDAIYAEDDGVGVRYNAGRGDVRNQPVETWVIRRADSAIWIQVNGSEYSGNLLIAETRPVQITAGLLPAEALRQQLEADGRVAIEVNFAVDDAEILQDSRPQIDQVTTLLREDDALRLSIEGHTDDTGDRTHNERLSAARAQSVLSALVGQGIEAGRLEARGHGASKPVDGNDTEEGRARNRRVELVRLG